MLESIIQQGLEKWFLVVYQIYSRKKQFQI